MKRNASAVWKGNGLEGKGTLSSANKFFNKTPYSFKSRFENEDGKLGTNPEELLAAAHAGCFNMQLSFMLVAAGFEPTELTTEAIVNIDHAEGGGFAIQDITLDLTGKVKGISNEQFAEIAINAKNACPISKALKSVHIVLKVRLLAK